MHNIFRALSCCTSPNDDCNSLRPNVTPTVTPAYKDENGIFKGDISLKLEPPFSSNALIYWSNKPIPVVFNPGDISENNGVVPGIYIATIILRDRSDCIFQYEFTVEKISSLDFDIIDNFDRTLERVQLLGDVFPQEPADVYLRTVVLPLSLQRICFKIKSRSRLLPLKYDDTETGFTNVLDLKASWYDYRSGGIGNFNVTNGAPLMNVVSFPLPGLVPPSQGNNSASHKPEFFEGDLINGILNDRAASLGFCIRLAGNNGSGYVRVKLTDGTNTITYWIQIRQQLTTQGEIFTTA